MREESIIRRNAHIARERKIQSATETIAANCRDHASGRPFDCAKCGLPLARKLMSLARRQPRELPDFRARCEGRLTPGNHAAAESSRREPLNLAAQFAEHATLQPRESIVAFECENQDAVIRRRKQAGRHCLRCYCFAGDEGVAPLSVTLNGKMLTFCVPSITAYSPGGSVCCG